MFSYIKIIITTAIICVFSSCNYNGDWIKINKWEVLYKQDKDLKTAALKKGWKPVELPSTFKLPYPKNKKFQYLWLRGYFKVDADPDQYYGITTGKVILTDEIYINNKLIGSTKLKKVNWSPIPRNYIIPKGVLKKGHNEIYFKLGIYGKYKGGILHNIIIHKENSYDLVKIISDLIFIQLPAGIVVISMSFILPILILYIWNRKEKLILYGLITLIIYTIYILTLLSTNRVISFELFLAVQNSISLFFAMIFILIIQSIYRIYLTSYNRIIIPLLFSFVLIIFIFFDSKYNYELGLILKIAALTITLPFVVFLIYKLNSVSKDKFLLYMIISLSVIVSFVIIFETYIGYKGGRYSDIIGMTSPIVILTLSAILLSREIMKRRIELEHFYVKLKKAEHQDKGLPITDTSEEKLKRVIDFINENYTSDLSREGLAAAVGINANYMGSLFKTYTGKTINEYINQLRIDEAIIQLKQKDIKITDIAFSVGFESLVTFNRVFKKTMGATPTEYRENA